MLHFFQCYIHKVGSVQYCDEFVFIGNYVTSVKVVLFNFFDPASSAMHILIKISLGQPTEAKILNNKRCDSNVCLSVCLYVQADEQT